MADLQQLFQLGQQMQGRLQQLQTELANRTIETSAGGGMVQGHRRRARHGPVGRDRSGRLPGARRGVPRRPGAHGGCRGAAARGRAAAGRNAEGPVAAFRAPILTGERHRRADHRARQAAGDRPEDGSAAHLSSAPAAARTDRQARVRAGRGERAGAAVRGLRQPHRGAALRRSAAIRGGIPALLCVVEEASTVGVVDRSTEFRGRYHVLGGRLSPLDGIGPEALRLDRAGTAGERGRRCAR